MTSSLDRGVAVIEALVHLEVELPDLVDALDAVVEGDAEIRQVLKYAESEGLIERDGKHIRQGRAAPAGERRSPRVITRDGEFACRRCGQSIGTGHFLVVNDREIGPYGSTCVARITGWR